jgi:hypothetical protein
MGRLVVMMVLSLKKKPTRTMVRTMSILAPSPGVLVRAKSRAARLLAYTTKPAETCMSAYSSTGLMLMEGPGEEEGYSKEGRQRTRSPILVK